MAKELEKMNEELARITRVVSEARMAAVRSEITATHTTVRIKTGKAIAR